MNVIIKYADVEANGRKDESDFSARNHPKPNEQCVGSS